jgi:hypothetical protein
MVRYYFVLYAVRHMNVTAKDIASIIYIPLFKELPFAACFS